MFDFFTTFVPLIYDSTAALALPLHKGFERIDSLCFAQILHHTKVTIFLLPISSTFLPRTCLFSYVSNVLSSTNVPLDSLSIFKKTEVMTQIQTLKVMYPAIASDSAGVFRNM